MKVLWQRGALTTTEVHEAVAEETDWHPKTVRTLLGRLVDKGVLRREKRAGTLRFIPVAGEEAYVREESRSFLDRCFGGALTPMMAHFLEHEDVDAETLAELQAMLKSRARKGKDK